MGASYSICSDNEELIDSIKESIQIPSDLERVLRLVDRGSFSVEPNSRIYSDAAWKSGTLHLSAPSIYCTVLREMDIHLGQSVLNIGSGTGYLSTMFGLLLGSNGVNHGIEVSKVNFKFSKTCLAKFVNTCDAVYERDFCSPYFMHGNIFTLVPPLSTVNNALSPSLTLTMNGEEDADEEDAVFNLPSVNLNPDEFTIEPPPLIKNQILASESVFWPLYDRIYVGSEVRMKEQLEAILRLLKIGGLLIAPVNDQFVKIERKSASKVKTTNLLNVSFASLVSPTGTESNTIDSPPPRSVERLERLTARALRYQLRRIVNTRKQGPPVLGRYVADEKKENESERKGEKEINGDNCEMNDENDTATIPEASPSSSTSSSTSNSFADRQSKFNKRKASSSLQADHESSPLKCQCPAASENAAEELTTSSAATSSSTVAESRGGTSPRRDDLWPFRPYLVLLESVLNRPRTRRVQNELEDEDGELNGRVVVVDPDVEDNVEVPGDVQEDDAESDDQEDKEETKKKSKKWIPQSYTYREEMLHILLKELQVPEFIAKRAMAVI